MLRINPSGASSHFELSFPPDKPWSPRGPSGTWRRRRAPGAGAGGARPGGLRQGSPAEPQAAASAAGAQLTWGTDLRGCGTGCQGAAPTDAHPTALGEWGAPPRLPAQSLPSPSATSTPKIKLLPVVLRESLSFLSLRNGKAASTTRGLDVLISGYKRRRRKKNTKPSSNAQGGVSSLLIAPTAQLGI